VLRDTWRKGEPANFDEDLKHFFTHTHEDECDFVGFENIMGIREHDAFLGHEMRGPAGTGCGGVSMAGGWDGPGARKGDGVRGHRLPSPPCFV